MFNRRPFKKLPGNRREWFERLDQPALKPLPALRYQVAYFKRCRVNIDYHIDIDGHYYSVADLFLYRVHHPASMSHAGGVTLCALASLPNCLNSSTSTIQLYVGQFAPVSFRRRHQDK